MASTDGRLPVLLVLSSTYPRWKDDPEPGFVHELCKRMVGDFRVLVLCPHAPGAAELECLDGVVVERYRYAPGSMEGLVNNGGVIENLRTNRWKLLLVPGFLIAQAFGAMRILIRERPAVVHAHWLIPQGFLVAGLASLGFRVPPFLVTSHGADVFSLHGAFLLAVKRFVLKRAARVTVVSRSMLEEVSRVAGDDVAVDVEPMGVDLAERFSPDPAVIRSSSELLFVGRLVEKKGLRHLIDALPEVLLAKPDVHLTVVGFGPEESVRRQQVVSLGLTAKVNFVGAVPQSELPGFYRRAALFVAPFVKAVNGDQEGLGLVLVEALGCACPVVVSDLPATRDVQSNSILRVKERDPKHLARGILEMLSAAGNAACASSDVGDFSWDRRAASYKDILKGLVPSGCRHDDDRSY